MLTLKIKHFVKYFFSKIHKLNTSSKPNLSTKSIKLSRKYFESYNDFIMIPVSIYLF